MLFNVMNSTQHKLMHCTAWHHCMTLHTYAFAYIHAYIACKHTCIHMRTYIHTYLHTCTDRQTEKQSDRPTDRQTCVCIYDVHTHAHTYIHAYIHILHVNTYWALICTWTWRHSSTSKHTCVHLFQLQSKSKQACRLSWAPDWGWKWRLFVEGYERWFCLLGLYFHWFGR